MFGGGVHLTVEVGIAPIPGIKVLFEKHESQEFFLRSLKRSVIELLFKTTILLSFKPFMLRSLYRPVKVLQKITETILFLVFAVLSIRQQLYLRGNFLGNMGLSEFQDLYCKHCINTVSWQCSSIFDNFADGLLHKIINFVKFIFT